MMGKELAERDVQYRARCPALKQLPAITQQQPVLIDIGPVIRPRHHIAHLDPQPAQRPGLDHVADIQVALPVLALKALAGVDVVAADITHGAGQAGQAAGGEVVVVAQLPGAFVGVGELVSWHFVAQRGDVGEDPGKALSPNMPW